MQRKRPVVVGLLVGGLLLSGCGGTLQLGLPTATPGIEIKGPESAEATVEIEGPVPELASEPVAPETTVSSDALPAEAAPAPPPAEAAVPVNPELANVQLPAPADLEARWRDMQVERVTFDPQQYVSPGYQVVWWYDPLFGQMLPIGQLRGDFTVQATFRIKGQWITALEIPYNVGKQYDIAVPDAILKRMQDAGKGEWAEVFVYQTNDIRPK